MLQKQQRNATSRGRRAAFCLFASKSTSPNPHAGEVVQGGMQGSYANDDMLQRRSAALRPGGIRDKPPTRLIRKKTRRARQASPETSRPAPARRPTRCAPGQQVTGASGASRQQVPKRFLTGTARGRPRRFGSQARSGGGLHPSRAHDAHRRRPGAAPPPTTVLAAWPTTSIAPRGACSSASTRRRAPRSCHPAVCCRRAPCPCSSRRRRPTRRWPTSIENPLQKRRRPLLPNRSTTKRPSRPRREVPRKRQL